MYGSDETSTLRQAIRDGNLVELRRIIQRRKLSVRAPNFENGWPLLFYAISASQNEVVRYLMDHGHEADGISRDFEGNTALIIAAQYKNEEAFQIYVERHPTVISLANNKGQTAIMVAVSKDLVEIVSMLLDEGDDANSADSEGSTLLHHASAWGQADMLHLLLNRGAAQSMNVTNKKGWKAIDYSYTSETRDYLMECERAMSSSKPLPPPPIRVAQPAPVIPLPSSTNTGASSVLSLSHLRSRTATEEGSLRDFFSGTLTKERSRAGTEERLSTANHDTTKEEPNSRKNANLRILFSAQ
ncbi:hypothetical protein SmJEL517_g03533 [Synchytrium microbalum]|uniref:Uncharacterized protein n=1 Tax=Synchytrium microbalum TaxID=1806994 RepID=A0A507C6F6_9FUNG|nr:uncharacterized protein SmJEL517_g03533 [Synchytrium microbalum]TPX33644.1 hypothetical protein SmJEL517_g03533 [Synchytrium microbalum]